ncbi:MAG TPA: M23 family metallopeptidase [Shinella sp.]|jgi:murein DD-endopeptidase MepM/ murein hydrolase activator NlpD|uniref:M23 family metallopeptidase n=1 Tax=Shinella sp. TaxID=1870904 RepID=UPI002E15DC93|nr:M23 family metallopeptidase [Shinella sp.]
MPTLAKSVVDVLLGEGVSGTKEERFQDFLGIASVIHNRSALLGVTPKDVVSVRAEFNAYNKALPAGVERYRQLAQEAWDEVQEVGPIHTGTFYATPNRAHVISAGKNLVDKTTGHQFYEDPMFRSIRTAKGFKLPNPERLPEVASTVAEYTAVPERRPELAAFDAVAEAPLDAAAQTAIENAVAQEGLNELGAVEREGYSSPFGAQGDRITSGFGLRAAPQTSRGKGSRNHAGIDMSLEPGQSGYPAEAAGAGVISDISYTPGGFGNKVSIRHPDGYTSTYGHLGSIAGNLNIGDEVAAGTPVGTVGSTGNSSGPHLHFQMEDEDGNPVDPRSMFSVDPEPSVPTPQFAERALAEQPGQMVSDIANSAISPSLGDPNEALEASFNMDRFAGPTQEQIANSDPSRLGDPNVALERSFDAARFAGPTIVNDENIASLQQRANEARVALDARIAQQVQTAGMKGNTPALADPTLSQPTGVEAAVENAGLSRSQVDHLKDQYGKYGMMKASNDILAGDVLQKEINEKTSRHPRVAQVQADPTYSQPIETKVQKDPALEVREYAQPEAVQDFSAVTTPTADVPMRAEQAVDQAAQKTQTEKEKQDAINRDRFAKSFTNSKTIGSLLGATIGGVLAGPVGAMALGGVGAKLGDLRAAERPRETPLQALFNVMMGKPQSMFPSTPPGGDGTGRGVGYGDLNEKGRGFYSDSGDFRDAIDKGGVGLY